VAHKSINTAAQQSGQFKKCSRLRFLAVAPAGRGVGMIASRSLGPKASWIVIGPAQQMHTRRALFAAKLKAGFVLGA